MSINVTMTLRQALRQLEAERGHIDRQIAALRGALDGLGTAGRSGRSSSSAGPGRRRRRMSAAARRATSRRMRAYWAKRRAAGARGKAKGAKAK